MKNIPDPTPRGLGTGGHALRGPNGCGHRNMGGRTCTREQGHAAKSHRYS